MLRARFQHTSVSLQQAAATQPGWRFGTFGANGRRLTFQENCRDILLQVSNFNLRQSKSPSIHPKAVIRLQVQKGCPQPPSTAPSSPSHLPPTGYNLKARPRVYNPPVVSYFQASPIAPEWLQGEAYPPGHPCTSADDGEQAASTVDQPPGPLV